MARYWDFGEGCGASCDVIPGILEATILLKICFETRVPLLVLSEAVR